MKSNSAKKFMQKTVVAVPLLVVGLWSVNKGGDWWGWFLAVIAVATIGEIVYQQFNCHDKRKGHVIHCSLHMLFTVLGCAVMYDLRTTKQGTALIVLGGVMVIAFDVFSQVSGMLLAQKGGLKIAPKESTNKTLQGLFGGMIVSVTAGGVAYHLLQAHYTTIPIDAGWMFIMMGYLPIIAYFCDLNESMAKRRLFKNRRERESIKDFSKLLWAHGGVSDRFDSWMAVFSTVGFAW